MAVLAVFAMPLLIPGSMAGGTTPGFSNTNTEVWETFWASSAFEGKIRVGRATDEIDGTTDWYMSAITLRQLQSNDLYRDQRFLLEHGEYVGTIPDEVDWAPGITEQGDDPVNYLIEAPLTDSVGSWENHWNGDWDIVNRDSRQSNNWKLYKHVEHWDSHGPHTFDWDANSFGATFKVEQGRYQGVAVKAYGEWSSSVWSSFSWQQSEWLWFPLEFRPAEGQGTCANTELYTAGGLPDGTPVCAASGSFAPVVPLPDLLNPE